MVPPLEIRLLGPFEVLVGGRPANVSGAKRQCLLALLALHGGRVVGVDSLVDAVWETTCRRRRATRSSTT